MNEINRYCGRSGPPTLISQALRVTFWSNWSRANQGVYCEVTAFIPSTVTTATPGTTVTTSNPTGSCCK